MYSSFKLIVPCGLGLYLASACVPDLDSLSAEYSASAGASGMGNSEGGMDSVGGATAGGTAVDTCQNQVKDPNESDVNCGGTSKCDRCATGGKCTANRDCESAFCKNNRCAEPTCTDKVKNQDETAVDCGGSCPACDIGVACATNADCTGEYCKDGVCADHCTSGTQEADETDKDCGGASCDPCANTKRCAEASDCLSLVCSNNKCQAASCSDKIQNQDESDTDCGGVCAATKPCPTNATCNSEADCASWICSTAGKCVADIPVDPAGMIDDFEDGDAILPAKPALGGRVGGWYHFSDGTGTGTATAVAINRGASLMGFHESGMGYTTWGSGVGADLNNGPAGKKPYEASVYDRVTFWARADNPLSVTVVFPDGDTDGAGGVCTTCDHHYYKNVAVGTTWQRFTVAFADLTLEPGTVPVPTKFAPEAIVSVQFRMTPGTTYNLYLDDIAFLKP